MWFPLALTAMMMLVVRRSSEKSLSGHIPATSMAWLQQLVALPFVGLTLLLPMATFFNPFSLSQQFYVVIFVYTLLVAIDVVLYFKAISIGDISVISAMITLSVVTNLIGCYFLLGQTPTTLGILGCICILIGAYLASRRAPSRNVLNTAAHRLAVILILIVVVLRGVYSPIEVIALRETDPFFFNFVTSLTVVPVIMLAMYMRGRQNGKPAFSKELVQNTIKHRVGLIIIGVTYTINLSCTFAAKLVAENAAYVTTIKGAQVLPMVLVGILLFNERVRKRQWLGLGIILLGLVFFSRA